MEIAPRLWRLRAPAGKDAATGRTRQVSRNFRASKAANRGGKGEALEALRKLIEEVGRGEHVGTSASFKVLAEEYLRHIKRTKEQGTYESYRIRLEQTAAPLAPIKLSALTAHDLDALYEKLASEGYASTTIAHLHSVISGALSQAVDWEWIDKNVAKRAHPPVARPKERQPLSPEEVLRLMLAARDRGDEDQMMLIYLLCLCGGRRGEALGFQWGDVDWERRLIKVERQIVPVHRIVPYPKGGKEKRRVEALGEAGVGMLMGYQDVQRSRFGESWTPRPDAWLISPDGGTTPLSPKGATVYIRTLGEKLEPSINARPHDFRRFSATQLGLAGASARAIMDRHGWSSLEIAQRYTLPVSASDQQAADIMGALLALPETAET